MHLRMHCAAAAAREKRTTCPLLPALQGKYSAVLAQAGGWAWLQQLLQVRSERASVVRAVM